VVVEKERIDVHIDSYETNQSLIVEAVSSAFLSFPLSPHSVFSSPSNRLLFPQDGMAPHLLYAGGYEKQIHTLSFDPSTNSLDIISSLECGNAPTWLTLSGDGALSSSSATPSYCLTDPPPSSLLLVISPSADFREANLRRRRVGST
jgi:hypothetical protein